jgi:PAS domain S-box-containing protein
MNFSFEKTILLGFALSLTLLAAIGYVSFKTGKRFVESAERIDHTHQVMEALSVVLQDVKNGESSARGYIISNDDDFLEMFSGAGIQRIADQKKLESLVSDNPLQTIRAKQLDSISKARLLRLNEFILTQKREGISASSGITRSKVGRNMMAHVTQLVTEMQDEERVLLAQRTEKLRNTASLNGIVNFLGTLGALLLLSAIYFLLRIEIKRRNKAEEAIKNSDRFTSVILENIPNMIFVKDAPSLRFLRFNKAGEDLLGYSSKDLIGKNDYDLFPIEQANFFTEIDRAAMKSETAVTVKEEPIKTRLRGERWLRTHKITILDDKGDPLYLVGISEDITEIKKQQDAILQLNQELEAFSYSVAHDLRAPLNGMNGLAGLFEKNYADKLDTEGIQMLGMLRTTSQSLSALIQDLLDFAKLGRQEIVRTKVDMNELGTLALKEASGTFLGNKPEIRFSEVPPSEGDKSMLKLVLINLFSNALKYSSKTATPVIEFGALDKGGKAIYFVKDNGVGFDQQYSDKLFRVFQRLHQQNEFDGTGVGLAIVERIITKHGGHVWAEGEPGKGATFYFNLS